MSQPPGQYGGQYGQPGPYGQQGQYGPPPGQYGPPPGQYGPPGGGFPPGGGPGGFGPGGYGQPPRKNSALPWIIVAVVVVLAGVGVLLFFLLRGDDNGSNTASTSTSTSSTSSTSTSSSPSSGQPAMNGGSGMGSGGLPGGASNAPSHPGGSMDDGSPSGGGTCQYDGCQDVANVWLSALLQGDADTAFQVSCTDLQDAATSGSDGTDLTPAEYLASYFYQETLGGQGFTDGTFTDISYDSDTGYDLVSADLTLEDGTTQSVTVAVDSNLTVCDWG